jgi:peptidoglycan/xylan/chitin deacetylase (PgdA/CDA1 family)
MPITLLYHDVTPPGQEDASGFAGAGAARYKLAPAEFRAHLDALAAVASGWQLTFDDGGVSAHDLVAAALEDHGWRGHFFVTTDYLGRPGFLRPEQVRDLRQRGHVIGSHSCSHPLRLSACGWGQLLDEWRRSRDVLEEVLGEPVRTASVPGGFYSRAVARAAAAAGVQVLFTSEPTAGSWTVDGCLVRGRYTVFRGTSAAQAAALASGRLLPRLRQALAWNVKKVAKAAGGGLYERLRERLLARACVAVVAGGER